MHLERPNALFLWRAPSSGKYLGHNWTAYRLGTQFGYGGLSLKMDACEMRARERATPMRYRHLRCTFCETYAPIRCSPVRCKPIRCRPLKCMSTKETRPEMHAPMSCAHPVK